MHRPKAQSKPNKTQPASIPEVIRIAGGYELHPHHFLVTGWNEDGSPRELTLVDRLAPGQPGLVFFANRPWLAGVRCTEPQVREEVP